MKIVAQISQSWNLRRLIGLLIGLFVAIQAIIYEDALLGTLSAFFLYQVVTNTGCFGSAACAINYPKTISED